LQTELAEEKSQSLHSQKSPRWAEQMYLTKEKNCYSEPKNGPKIFDKLKPEPSQTLNSRRTYNAGAKNKAQIVLFWSVTNPHS